MEFCSEIWMRCLTHNVANVLRTMYDKHPALHVNNEYFYICYVDMARLMLIPDNTTPVVKY